MGRLAIAKRPSRPSPRRHAHRRGRPQKYGRPSQVVAVTLPVEVVDGLRRLHSDLGWAIVRLLEKTRPPRRTPPVDEAELVEIGGGQSLIVVSSKVLTPLPGVQMVPLSDTQAFLALAPGKGMADLEVAVLDRLEHLAPRSPERAALTRLVRQLRRWRRDTTLSFDARSIILVGRQH